MNDVRGKRVLVVGLARSGHAVALCLRRRGALVTVSDVRPPHAFQAILPELMAEKIGLELGSQSEETFLQQDLVVVSPGVPWNLPQLLTARQHGIPVVPEVEAASWFLDGTLIGVTGSNGKTTTASLLGKILQASRFPAFVGGNIGVPLSTAVGKVQPGSFLVTELSSFQLEAIHDFRPHVAVFLNLSPNHLDRHPTMEAYALAKQQIFRNQRAEDYAILNLDDPAVAKLASTARSQKVFFSRRVPLPEGLFVSDGHVVYRVGHLERILFETREVAMRGGFNLENVLAAAAAACVLGADFDAMRAAIREFRGVEHRLEFVQTIQGVEFYNNSKATSVDATVKSLEAFERGVHLILGGKDKGAPYAPIRPLLSGRVRELLLIGAAAGRIAKELSGAAEIVPAGDLATAVREAFRRAEPGDIVLLAPACSSFDQFQDFEHRGRVFKELVHNLAREVETEPTKWEKPEPKLAATAAVRPSPEQDAKASPASIESPPREADQPPVAPQRGDTLGGTTNQSQLGTGGSPVISTSEEPLVGKGFQGPPSRPLELVYVYEVGAEEQPRTDLEPPSESADDVSPAVPVRSMPLETVEDESLPFEARPEVQSRAGAVTRDSKGSKSPGLSAGQRRLPGLE